MTISYKSVFMTGAAIFALGLSPAMADSGINATIGADVGAGARIQDHNSGTTAGTTVDSLMEREDALSSKTVTGTGLTLDNNTNVQAGTEANMNAMNSERLNFNDADANNDGVVDEAEFSTSVDAETSIQSFSEFDLNKDGVLDETEFRSYLEADTQTEAEVEASE